MSLEVLERVEDARESIEHADLNPGVGLVSGRGETARDKAQHYAAAYKSPEFKMEWQGRFLILPMVIAGLGILISIMGIFMVRTKEGATFKELLKALGMPIWVTSILLAILSFVAVFILLEGHFLGVAMSISVHVLLGALLTAGMAALAAHVFRATREPGDA